MTTVEDNDLLRSYAVDQSEDAFSRLVAQYINLVYATALRLIRQPEGAKEVTQLVFIDLAKKAAYLASGTVLSGWLYRSTIYAAANLQRAERRRQLREAKALELQVTMKEHESIWQALSPHLEQAMERLKPTDQNALLLHYFEGKSMHEVGATLAISDAAAQKRVHRAIVKLRRYFSRHGVKQPVHAARMDEEPMQMMPLIKPEETPETMVNTTPIVKAIRVLMAPFRAFLNRRTTVLTLPQVEACLSGYAWQPAPLNLAEKTTRTVLLTMKDEQG